MTYYSESVAQSKLEAFEQILPIIHSMLPEMGIGMTNTTEWLTYYPGTKINLGVKKGTIINPDEPLADCIQGNKLIKQEVPAKFFGVSFTGLAYPIIEEGQVIGALAIQIQEHNERALKRISDQIFSSLTQANQRVVQISNGSEDLSNVSEILLEESTRATKEMKNTDEVINFIKKIANQTNILGLNASIEAARAGDKGRGFDVVAKEIRKLSNETVQSTDEISEILLEMQQSINKIQGLVEKIVTVGREQEASTKEVASFINEIEEMSDELKSYAMNL
ncbi:methyl-accepting chemotaxis protein [Gracilibacillus boraciitolerans JCM 21714]|uniref:Methyl-accepting chemotaxis protein n=1 Tax=Gracilibacillus boraciitolerans JCM 21714 TaxID=1298598 RepID=W4VMK0_9BACI|nr:methyl-accepting chemotaxis protein [Gracilibacillus boraciitolerans]GAE93959.1 methyl-accepting chemotaxis protein [Gracilibacillus boraciitolerans JCM 21714]